MLSFCVCHLTRSRQETALYHDRTQLLAYPGFQCTEILQHANTSNISPQFSGPNFSKCCRPVCQIPRLTAPNFPSSTVSYLLSKLKTLWIIQSMKTSVTLCIKCSMIIDHKTSVGKIFFSVAVEFCRLQNYSVNLRRLALLRKILE